jgi:hypothetical protein
VPLVPLLLVHGWIGFASVTRPDEVDELMEVPAIDEKFAYPGVVCMQSPKMVGAEGLCNSQECFQNLGLHVYSILLRLEGCKC